VGSVERETAIQVLAYFAALIAAIEKEILGLIGG